MGDARKRKTKDTTNLHSAACAQRRTPDARSSPVPSSSASPLPCGGDGGEVKFDRAPIHGGLGGRSPELRGLGERVTKLSHRLVPQGWGTARQDLELLSLQGDCQETHGAPEH